MYIPISKEAPVLGMRPSDTRRPLERERERERDHWTSEVVSVLSLSQTGVPAAVSMIQAWCNNHLVYLVSSLSSPRELKTMQRCRAADLNS